MVLSYISHIKSFGLKRKLFSIKTSGLIPIEKCLPENITNLLVTGIAFSVAGYFFSRTDLPMLLYLPFVVMFGLLVCFVLQHVVLDKIVRRKALVPPKGDDCVGIEGCVTIPFSGETLGQITFEYAGTEFKVYAVSANGTDIPEFERVLILCEQDGAYFVEHISEVYDDIDETP
jgi:hypothetical protein